MPNGDLRYRRGGIWWVNLDPIVGSETAKKRPCVILQNDVVVIPIGQTQDGLPIGIHLVGKRWQDYELLDLAEKIVEVTGAITRPPGY